jgi:hypothetical protein
VRRSRPRGGQREQWWEAVLIEVLGIAAHASAAMLQAAQDKGRVPLAKSWPLPLAVEDGFTLDGSLTLLPSQKPSSSRTICDPALLVRADAARGGGYSGDNITVIVDP